MKLTKEQKQEIAVNSSNTTKGYLSRIRKILYEALPVLDHGFVRWLIMGDDSSIVQSARVSYGKGTKKFLLTVN